MPFVYPFFYQCRIVSSLHIMCFEKFTSSSELLVATEYSLQRRGYHTLVYWLT